MKEIKLYGVISNEGFLGMGENGYIERIANEIKAAGDEDILLKINTPGGSVFDGFAIITNLLEHSGNINMQVDGYAASMGGAILAYADHATAFDFAKVMLHKVWTYSEDEDSLALVDKLNGEFAEMFKGKGVDADLIDEIFLGEDKKDYWFTAQEAKEIGLIDEVLESNQTQKAAASSEDLIKKYYQFTNQKSEVIMFKNSKEALQKLQDAFDELQALKSEVPTKEDVLNMTQEAAEKLTEDINKANQEKAEAASAEAETFEQKVEKSLAAIVDSVEALADTVKSLSEDVTAVNAKIDNTISAIKEVTSEFEVPEVVDSETAETAPPTGAALHAKINKEINMHNAERVKK